MGAPAAKQGDRVTAIDLHLVQPPTTAPPVTLPHPFSGILSQQLSADVRIMGMPAATVGSVAINTPPHIPQGGTFVNPPDNRGTVKAGSGSVRIGGKAAARAGDRAETCGEPTNPGGLVVATGTVRIGG
ncbi:MAG: PAAR domain-containing protein [Nocardioides sp.]